MDTDSSASQISRAEEPLLPNSVLIVKSKEPSELKLDTLTRLQVIGYSVGHFQNDLFAACWFNYLLYYLKNVVFASDPDSSFYAGIVLLSGQIADGIATPLVGFFSDKTDTRFGKRTPWYLVGTIVVTICFILLWQDLEIENKALKIAYYIVFPSALNIGWAAVQVAHMSLVPSLTLSRRTRDKLNNYRNTFTYVANLYVLTLAFFLFLLLNSESLQFRILALGCLGLGVLATLFYVFTVNEKKIVQGCKEIEKQFNKQHKLLNDSENAVNIIEDGVEKLELAEDEATENIHLRPKKKTGSMTSSVAGEEAVCWKHWFKIPAFYIYGFVYMACRLLVNVQSSLIIFYLQNVLGIAKGINSFTSGLPIEFAIIPMIIYLSSTISSTLLKILYMKIGRKKTFTLGALMAVAGVISMLFLNEKSKNFIYPTAILIGIGQSIFLNTGIAFIGEVVGVKGSSGAFVFGAYSLLDKFASGIVLYLVVNLRDVSDPANSSYVRICATAFPGVAIILAWVLIMIGKAADYDAGDAVMDKPKKAIRPIN